LGDRYNKRPRTNQETKTKFDIFGKKGNGNGDDIRHNVKSERKHETDKAGNGASWEGQKRRKQSGLKSELELPLPPEATGMMMVGATGQS
jgi:hypothetical protein